MAITYPRAMPARLAQARFEPDFQTVHNPLQGGQMQAIVTGPARWRAAFSTAPLREPYLSEWRAWLASLENGVGAFYAADPAKPAPLNYPGGFAGLTRNGGAAFDGTATSWSVDAARKALTLNGLPATYAAAAGDLVMFAWDGSKRYLARALESAAAAAGVLTVTVTPRIETFVNAGAIASLIACACVMKIEPGSVEIDLKPGPIGQANFRAVQFHQA